MEKPTTVEALRKAILLQELRIENEQKLFKEQFSIVVNSFHPVNILRRIFLK